MHAVHALVGSTQLQQQPAQEMTGEEAEAVQMAALGGQGHSFKRTSWAALWAALEERHSRSLGGNHGRVCGLGRGNVRFAQILGNAF